MSYETRGGEGEDGNFICNFATRFIYLRYTHGRTAARSCVRLLTVISCLDWCSRVKPTNLQVLAPGALAAVLLELSAMALTVQVLLAAKLLKTATLSARFHGSCVCV